MGNYTESEQIVELSIDTTVFNYSRKEIKTKFCDPKLPFELSEGKNDNIVNSEVKTESWFIENPMSKDQLNWDQRRSRNL